ncbi:MAG: hypothetical protein V1775_18240 [Bacteroidota bacterium]
MLKYPDYEPAVKRLKALNEKADQLLTSITAENMTQAIRERNTVMIELMNLNRKFQEKGTTPDVMDYKIVEYKQKR